MELLEPNVRLKTVKLVNSQMFVLLVKVNKHWLKENVLNKKELFKKLKKKLKIKKKKNQKE